MSEDTNPQVPNDKADSEESSDDILDQASGGRGSASYYAYEKNK